MTEVNRVDSEAALWVVKQLGGSLSAEDQQAFEAWLADDPRHRGSFIRLNAVNADLRRLSALSAGAGKPAAPADEFSAIRFDRRRVLAAGVGALAMGSGAWWAWRGRGESYVSGIGELRQVSLVDGSSMMLNTATETRVRFSDQDREVLLARGEVHFEVAKDRERPFVVRTGNLTVTAIGTAFTVRMDGALTEVTVTEGVVELGHSGSGLAAEVGARRRVAANQRAIVAAARPVEVRAIEHDEAERRLAWRTGMVAFNGEPLAEAVAEINRHNRRHIVIEDPALAGRPVIGMFRANDIETFARTAAAAMGAEVVDEDGLIRLETKRGK